MTAAVPFRPVIYLIAAVLVVCLGLAAFFLRSHFRPDDFDSYRIRLARAALQSYRMDLQSHDLPSINAFLKGRKAPSDYVLPGGVSKAQPVGCAVLSWQGQPVSMLCFRSGQTLAPGQPVDLWLFVGDAAGVRGGPPSGPPVIAHSLKLTTASWIENGKLYILAGDGDETFLRKYL